MIDRKPGKEVMTRMEKHSSFYEILLLDDDEDDYVLVKSMLHTSFGATVNLDWYQKDGVATEMICSGLYVVTLVDYRLGKENGLEVLRVAKSHCPDQAIFLFTGWTHDDIEQKAKNAGANGVLQKNQLSAETLKAAIEPFLNQSQKGA